MNCHCHTHPKFNSSPLNNDTWKMKLPFGALPIFRCYKYLNFRDRNSLINWYILVYRFFLKRMLGYVGSLLAIHLVTYPTVSASEKCADPLSTCTSRVASSKGNGAAWVVPLGSKVLASGFPKDQRLDPPNGRVKFEPVVYSRGVLGLLKMTVSFEGGQDT